MRELGRVVKPGGIIRCLEYTRPSGGFRRAMTRLWEPWVYWAYGARFDRPTEKLAPDAGLHLFESRFVHDELIKLLSARAWTARCGSLWGRRSALAASRNTCPMNTSVGPASPTR